MNRPAAIAVDARSLQPANRTEQILDAFDKLTLNAILEINEETDPRALRVQLRAARAWSRLRYVARLTASRQRRLLVTQQDWL